MASQNDTQLQPGETTKQSSSQRLAPLDGLRAIAIIWVAIYHFFYFWAPAGGGDPILPYGDMLAWVPLADVGGFGVYLFFMVSGFVIMMTLERTAKLMHFAVRRSARIFPTLMLCGCITWLVGSAIGPESFERGIWEFLLSIFSLPPENVGPIFGQPDWQWLDGAYWSLWVELRFYAVIGVLYFVFRKSWAIGWFSFQFLTGAMAIAYYVTGNFALERIGSLLIYEFVPLFSIGIIAYLAFTRQAMSTWMKWALAISVLHATFTTLFLKGGTQLSASIIIGYVLMLCLFLMAVTPSGIARRVMSWGPLVILGRASYSYYLLHQVIGLSVLYWFGTFLPAWVVALVILPLLNVALVAAAMTIYSLYEQPLNKSIVTRFTRSPHRKNVAKPA